MLVHYITYIIKDGSVPFRHRVVTTCEGLGEVLSRLGDSVVDHRTSTAPIVTEYLDANPYKTFHMRGVKERHVITNTGRYIQYFKEF